MILYMDTSALVKGYIREARSEDVVSIIGRADAVGSSVLARVEMASALAKGIRLGWVEEKSASRAWKDFLAHWHLSHG